MTGCPSVLQQLRRCGRSVTRGYSRPIWHIIGPRPAGGTNQTQNINRLPSCCLSWRYKKFGPRNNDNRVWLAWCSYPLDWINEIWWQGWVVSASNPEDCPGFSRHQKLTAALRRRITAAGIRSSHLYSIQQADDRGWIQLSTVTLWSNSVHCRSFMF